MTRASKFVVLGLITLPILFLLLRSFRRAPDLPENPATRSGRISPELAAEIQRIEAAEARAAETVWAKEILAQQCGRTVEALWDSLNAASNKLEVMAGMAFEEIILGDWSAPRHLPHGIEVRESTQARDVLSNEGWRQFVRDLAAASWELLQTEFRHNRFDVDATGRPRQSQFYFSAHLINRSTTQRAALEGNLVVHWTDAHSANAPAAIEKIDASKLALTLRTGEPPFQRILTDTIQPIPNSQSIDPLIAYDLDRDGRSEIILAGRNLVYQRTAEGSFATRPLCDAPPGAIFTAVIADFDRDAVADFLCVKYEGLFFYRGSEDGTFRVPGRLVFARRDDWQHPMTLTCGDIDCDGDLDLFMGQYKEPYEGGAVPTPFYDANDGYPAYLLVNDGRASFSDVTETAGLGSKRRRRTYSSSFVDLNRDTHLDLVVVSDFAGLDIYQNDGAGRFKPVTRAWAPNAHAFGMAHALADFNVDGRLDLLMIGMTSPTVERLDFLELTRGETAVERAMRTSMTFGNRLYLARATGGFEQTEFSQSIARAGWAWGCAALDFDNDGFPDVYIANGLESNRSVRDYEPEYWLHDRFVGTSREESAPYLYFRAKFDRTRGRGYSYGGYEKNRFYLNQKAESFFECGHVMGLALEQDCRNVVADDIDADGRMDLIVTTLELWPRAQQTFSIFQNRAAHRGNWIGFRFREQGQGLTPVGLAIEIFHGNRSTVRQIVTGDSYRSQHAATVHFGIGQAERIERAEIRWANGVTLTVREPAVNQYHWIEAPRVAPPQL